MSSIRVALKRSMLDAYSTSSPAASAEAPPAKVSRCEGVALLDQVETEARAPDVTDAARGLVLLLKTARVTINADSLDQRIGSLRDVTREEVDRMVEAESVVFPEAHAPVFAGDRFGQFALLIGGGGSAVQFAVPPPTIYFAGAAAGDHANVLHAIAVTTPDEDATRDGDVAGEFRIDIQSVHELTEYAVTPFNCEFTRSTTTRNEDGTRTTWIEFRVNFKFAFASPKGTQRDGSRGKAPCLRASFTLSRFSGGVIGVVTSPLFCIGTKANDLSAQTLLDCQLPLALFKYAPERFIFWRKQPRLDNRRNVPMKRRSAAALAPAPSVEDMAEGVAAVEVTAAGPAVVVEDDDD